MLHARKSNFSAFTTSKLAHRSINICATKPNIWSTRKVVDKQRNILKLLYPEKDADYCSSMNIYLHLLVILALTN